MHLPLEIKVPFMIAVMVIVYGLLLWNRLKVFRAHQVTQFKQAFILSAGSRLSWYGFGQYFLPIAAMQLVGWDSMLLGILVFIIGLELPEVSAFVIHRLTADKTQVDS